MPNKSLNRLALPCFKLEDILTKAKKDIPTMKQNPSGMSKEKQLTFDVKFKYKTIDGDEEYSSPPQKYYYDFTRDTLVFDR